MKIGPIHEWQGFNPATFFGPDGAEPMGSQSNRGTMRGMSSTPYPKVTVTR